MQARVTLVTRTDTYAGVANSRTTPFAVDAAAKVAAKKLAATGYADGTLQVSGLDDLLALAAEVGFVVEVTYNYIPA